MSPSRSLSGVPASQNVKLRVGRVQQALLASGHPWLFDRGIVSQRGDGPPGTLAVVYDGQNRLLAVGLYDPGSPIRFRLLEVRKAVRPDLSFWRGRVAAAILRRAPLAASGTTGYRLIHGESDGLPALVADRYGETQVVKVYSAAMLPHLAAILEALSLEQPADRVVLRLCRLLQTDGAHSTGYRDGQVLRGSIPEGPVRFLEAGLHFEADTLHGQKTGFYLDQRENRQRVGTLARGRSVLNVFCFSGGFSLHAAAGGASRVCSIDASQHALDSAARNFSLNPALASVPQELIRAEAFEHLARMGREGRRFGLVILDPPSFARSKAQREDALRAYRRLASLAARLTSPGGIVVSCSCSSHIGEEEFEAAVKAGLTSASWRLLKRRGHAPDHPVGFPEARYLKAVYFERGPG